jgi:hypothetical protein
VYSVAPLGDDSQPGGCSADSLRGDYSAVSQATDRYPLQGQLGGSAPVDCSAAPVPRDLAVRKLDGSAVWSWLRQGARSVLADCLGGSRARWLAARKQVFRAWRRSVGSPPGWDGPSSALPACPEAPA